MKRITLRLNNVDQVLDFVKVISAYPCEADIRYGSCVVDAKSLMGVISLATAKTVELVLHSDWVEDEIDERLKDFAA